MAIIAPLAIRLALFFSHSSISLRFLSIFALFVLFVLSLVTRQSNYLTSPNRRAPLLLMPSPLLSGQLKGRFRAKSIRKNFAPALSLIFRCSFCFNGKAGSCLQLPLLLLFLLLLLAQSRRNGKEKAIQKSGFYGDGNCYCCCNLLAFPFQFKMQSSRHRLCRQSIQ